MPARTIQQWHDIFKEMPTPANAVNCAYRLLGDITGYSTRTSDHNKDQDADQIANALLAFKRIGSDDDGDIIYVESAWVTKFVDFLIEQSLRYRLDHQKDEKCKIILPKGFNLREELPSHLRGKFSTSL
jgi:hypothetical protein